MRLPPEMKNFRVYDPGPDQSLVLSEPSDTFKAYGAAVAAKEDGAGNIWRAALGSIGDDKTTFYVWVWVEKKSGVEVISIADPPRNAPALYTKGNSLVLIGVLDGEFVERIVPGFVASPPPLTLAQLLGALAERLKVPDAPITKAMATAALAALEDRLRKAATALVGE